MEQPPPQSAQADDEEAKRQEACKRLEHIMAKPLEVVEPFPFETLDADLRRNVLTFVLTAPTDGATSVLRVVKRKNKGEYPRVPESATMALRTLVHHTRTIKAVSTAVCADVRVLEKTVVKPEKWLEGLWLVEAGARSRDQALAECRQRTVVAGRANIAVELYSRLGHCGDRREVVVKCPATWPEQRAKEARDIFQMGGEYGAEEEENKDIELSWAHTRCKPAEEVHGLAPVDAKYLKALASAAFGGFVDAVRHLPSWTLLVTDVKLLYIGGYLETTDDNGVRTGRTRARGDAADYDALDAGLAAFFGEETVRRAPWVKAWCNGRRAYPYDDEEFTTVDPQGVRAKILARRHDASRPPLTRIRDADKDELLPMGDLQLAGNDFSFASDKPPLSAATIDITFADDAQAAEQAPFQYEPPNSPPSFTFIQGIDSLTCRGGGTCGNLDDVKFKIKTHVHSRAKNLEDAILWVPIVEGVFQVLCSCKIVGLS